MTSSMCRWTRPILLRRLLARRRCYCTKCQEYDMQITGIDHTSYTVSSLERSLEFYVGLLGFEVLWQREITNQYFRDIVAMPDCVVKAAHLRIPGSIQKLELFEYMTPLGVP